VEYYFAEFLSLLEIPNAEGRYLDVITDEKYDDPKLLKNGRLKLPENMWFIGTANNDDSTFAISDKVYDRAMIMNLDKKSKWFDAPKTSGVQISIKHWNSLVKEAIGKYKITYRNKKRIQKLDDYLIKHFHITFGNRIMKQINQYVPVMIACGGEELEAIDDILSKKVLRKLESQNPIYVRNSVDGLRTYLDELFGQDKMQSCKAYLTRLEHNA
jgi:5-methylcytosine-specific restriction endonuclease McrBC GTP-binding regulatory subunit McrB